MPLIFGTAPGVPACTAGEATDEPARGAVAVEALLALAGLPAVVLVVLVVALLAVLPVAVALVDAALPAVGAAAGVAVALPPHAARLVTTLSMVSSASTLATQRCMKSPHRA
ncbi:MAG: hypothetical protein ACTHMA_14375 [Thermomicrobiales bacterium]